MENNIDYASIAKQFGGKLIRSNPVSSQIPLQNQPINQSASGGIDYASIAKQFGGKQVNEVNISEAQPQNTIQNTNSNPLIGIGGPVQLTSNMPILPDIGQGIVKSGAGLLAGTSEVGRKIGNYVAKIPGLGFLNQPNVNPITQALQNYAQPSNFTQEIGKVIGDIGTFFIPGAAEESAIAKANDIIDSAKIAEKYGPAVADALKIAIKSLAGAGSMGGITALQTGGDKSQTGYGAILGAVSGPLEYALGKISPEIVKSLNKADFKLSGVNAAKVAQKADDAAKFITDNHILGSNTAKYEKLQEITSQIEDALKSSLPNVKIPSQVIIDNINKSVEALKSEDPAIYNEAKNAANKAISLLKERGSISIDDALRAKRSYGNAAFRMTKFTEKDISAANIQQANYLTELAYEKAIEDTMKSSGKTIKIPEKLQPYFGGKTEMSLNDFNKIYSKAISAKNLSFMGQFRSGSTLVGRIFGLWAGSSLGETILPGLGGQLGGGIMGEIASNKLPGLVRNVGERVLTSVPNFINPAIKSTAGIMSSNKQNQKYSSQLIKGNQD
jgi:hypothetical protein